MAAPKNNQNAAKPEDEQATSHLNMRCRPAEKSRWVRAAQARAQRLKLSAGEAKLAAFVTDTLNRAAAAELGPP